MGGTWKRVACVVAAGALVVGGMASAQGGGILGGGQPGGGEDLHGLGGQIGGQPFGPPMGLGQPAIAVSDGFVFVVQDGTLYKFSADTLELTNKVTFVETPPYGFLGGAWPGGSVDGLPPGFGGPPKGPGGSFGDPGRHGHGGF